jgi:hypothetical protein
LEYFKPFCLHGVTVMVISPWWLAMPLFCLLFTTTNCSHPSGYTFVAWKERRPTLQWICL